MNASTKTRSGRYRFALLGLWILFLPSMQARGFRDDRLIERKVDSLLAIMTLEEKLGQLNQPSARGEWSGLQKGISEEQKEMVRRGQVGSFLNCTGAQTLREIQRIAVEESRLGIPLIFAYDVIHGYRTIFPIPLGEASTWSPGLIEQAARVAAREAAAAGLHWTFAPMVDIARDPRWGRIAEGSGEDPFLGSAMAVARVRGFQGSDFADAVSLLACAKHFAAYGGAEAGRDYNTVDMSERTLRMVYLRPFKAAVDAGVGSFMSAFNEIGGVPSTGSSFLLSKVLRDEWGFTGMVVSDWTAVMELMHHGIAATREEAGMVALRAGVDIDMESKIYITDLPDPVRRKALEEDVVNRSVRRVLRMKFRLGLFSDPYRKSDVERERTSMLTAEHRALARKVATQSFVLLRNEQDLLPLAKNLKTIAVIGPLAEGKLDPMGVWAALGRAENVVNVLEGIRSKVSRGTQVLYAKGSPIDSVDRSGFDEARRLAGQADAVILVVGEAAWMSGEAASRTNIGLPGVQEELVREIHKSGKPVAMVLMNGRPLTMPWVYENVPAILETWFPGTEAGNAIADVLFGDANPGGKLPVTFPRSIGQIPLYYNHKNTGRPPSDTEHFTSKYFDSPVTPQFPFGFGLSYTKFSYNDLRVSTKAMGISDSLRVSVRVKNEGKREGDEVVQLYVRDVVASVTRPVLELKGFRRITLKPGEARTVEFVLQSRELGLLNDAMQWRVEPGLFKVFVGTNSTDLLEAQFEIVAR
ncbi:MAG: beta-glucosidase BglX [Bacteroidota bacterium]